MANFRINASVQCSGPDAESHGTPCPHWGEGVVGLTTNHDFEEVLTVVEVPKGWAFGLHTADPKLRPVLCPDCASRYAHDLQWRAEQALEPVEENLGGDAHRGSPPGGTPS